MAPMLIIHFNLLFYLLLVIIISQVQAPCETIYSKTQKPSAIPSKNTADVIDFQPSMTLSTSCNSSLPTRQLRNSCCVRCSKNITEHSTSCFSVFIHCFLLSWAVGKGAAHGLCFAGRFTAVP